MSHNYESSEQLDPSLRTDQTGILLDFLQGLVIDAKREQETALRAYREGVDHEKFAQKLLLEFRSHFPVARDVETPIVMGVTGNRHAAAMSRA